jgi:adenosine deaminase
VTGLDLRSLPKAELHLHFEAAMSREFAVALADRSGLPAPATGSFPDLSAFVIAYERARDIVGSLDDLRDLARDLGTRQRAAGVVWSEIHFVPATYAGRLGPDDGLVEAVLDGLAAGAGADHAGLVIAVNRGLPLEAAESMLDLAVRWTGRGVVGFGLAGDEANHPAEKFTGLFHRARAIGLRRVPHAGEGAGADHVRRTVELLGPDRVCHGVRALDDDDVVDLLRERDVCLDMAPTSNVLLGVVPELASHPLPVLARRGVPVTLNTDIPLFTGADLVEEYARCAAAWDLTDDEVVALARTSLERSSCPDHVRSAALRELDAVTV